MSITSITSQNLPILENGDRATRDEFERRYHRMSNVKKCSRDVPWNVSTYDVHDKLQAYRRNGVREYLIWLIEKKL